MVPKLKLDRAGWYISSVTVTDSDPQRQTVVAAYFKSEQLPLFALAWQITAGDYTVIIDRHVCQSHKQIPHADGLLY